MTVHFLSVLIRHAAHIFAITIEMTDQMIYSLILNESQPVLPPTSLHRLHVKCKKSVLCAVFEKSIWVGFQFEGCPFSRMTNPLWAPLTKRRIMQQVE